MTRVEVLSLSLKESHQFRVGSDITQEDINNNSSIEGSDFIIPCFGLRV